MSSSEVRWAGEAARGLAISGTWMRGGTSKCWVFRSDHLPADPELRDAVLLRLFGSPDQRQIDGVGGGSSTTSKVLVVGDTDPASATVGYEVGQVSVNAPRVEWVSNCGNCASALALYVAQEGLVPLDSPTTTMTLINRRTGLALDALVASPDVTTAPRDGTELIPGTAYPGVRVSLRWTPPSWSAFGTTLPTGNATDVIEMDGLRFVTTLVDAGAPAALVSAADLGLADFPGNAAGVEALLPLLMRVRSAAAKLLGLPSVDVQSIPKVGVIGPGVPDRNTDVEACMVSMTALHPAIGITSAVAVAAAAAIGGTTVHEAVRGSASNGAGHAPFRIGTPAGRVVVDVDHDPSGGAIAIDCVRSARRLADASVHVGSDWIELRNLP